MATRPQKPVAEMTEVEFRAWKDWLLAEVRHPSQMTVAATADGSRIEYDEDRGAVVERTVQGGEHVLEIRNGELRPKPAARIKGNSKAIRRIERSIALPLIKVLLFIGRSALHLAGFLSRIC